MKDIEEVREQVKEIIAGVRFGTMPSWKAIIELMVIIRSRTDAEVDSS